jgi:hypothetical protein
MLDSRRKPLLRLVLLVLVEVVLFVYLGVVAALLEVPSAATFAAQMMASFAIVETIRVVWTVGMTSTPTALDLVAAVVMTSAIVDGTSAQKDGSGKASTSVVWNMSAETVVGQS